MAETDLGIRYPVDADAPDGPTQIGNAAKDADALIQVAGVAKRFVSASAGLTRASASYGSFSTPVKVSGLRVEAGQLLEIRAMGFIKSSIKTVVESNGAWLTLLVNGVEIAGITQGKASPEDGGAGEAEHWSEFRTQINGFNQWQTDLGTGTPADFVLPKLIKDSFSPVTLLAAEDTTTDVELVGKNVGGGTITVARPRLYVIAYN